MKQVYGYIRVSTKEQGNGASLPEQKSAIIEFAQKNNLKIIHFYEEKKTAAKQGRPLFLEMLNNLKGGKASGVIMHKIDRSARNLHDWASVGDLIDNGINVFFAHESLNMNERGGRLSADIQAVMASDYVRNLRQETIKGLYGRLKQGIFPWGAPVGYVDNGKGKLKTIDPIQGELVKQLFKLYVSGKYNILELSKEMERRGLRNQRGNRVCKNGISRILKNPFYIGLMKAKEKIFKGKHDALIDSRTFEQVQLRLKSRDKRKGIKHHYLFSKQVKCEHCGRTMSGEMHKGHVYYRCQTKTCPTKTIREDTLEHYIKNILKTITLSLSEINSLKYFAKEGREHLIENQKKVIQGYRLQINQLEQKEKKLLDAYLDNMIEKDNYEKRRKEILFKQIELEERIQEVTVTKDVIFDTADKIIELCKSPLNFYKSAIQEERREMLEIITSNLSVQGKKAIFTIASPFYELANRDIFSLCAHSRDTTRKLYRQIVFMDKKTSAVLPKPLNKAQLKEFYKFIYQSAITLSRINKLKDEYEISKDNTSS